MSSSVIGALRVNLGLDSAQFERGTGKAQKSLRNMRNQFAAVAGAAAALGTAIAAMAIKGGNDIDRVVKSARRIDGTAGAFQALELAAGEAGVSLSGLTNDIQTMNRELSSGSAGAIKALDRLGMSADELLSMDADERVASVADRVKELGLSAGEATGLLRDLGIRNREMALLMIQGGDAIRDARDDIRSYGLEIDDALGAKIEQANDRIARLGIVSQYLGQRLAAELVPAMGMFAQSVTDAMREGGALRAVIDGLVDNLQLMASIVAVTVTAFGVRYVGALVAAKLATFSLTGALVALRTALLRTGIGALVVGAGFLVDKLITLRMETGSWGAALEALGRVAAGVWEGIRTSAQAIVPALNAVWARVRSGFFDMLSDLALKWSEFLSSIADAATSIPVLGGAFSGIEGAASNARAAVRDFAVAATAAGNDFSSLRSEAGALASAGFDRAREALTELNGVVSENVEGTTDAADAARALNDELDGIAGSGGGGGGGSGGASGAAGAVNDLNDALDDVSKTSFRLNESLGSVFADALTGAKNLNDGIKDLLKNMSSMFLNQAFSQLLGSAFPSFNFGGFRADGGPVSPGRSYVVGERGPEIFTPQGSGHIIPNERLGGGGATTVQVINYTGAPVREERSQGPDGREIIRTIIGEEIGSGRMDKPFGRFGLSPAKVRR